jgi:hypothetical protein
MKGCAPAFLRKQLSMLVAIEDVKSAAKVRLGAQELGTWESVRPRCGRAGNRIRPDSAGIYGSSMETGHNRCFFDGHGFAVIR